MIPWEKRGGEDEYGSFKYGTVNMSFGEARIFIKCPDKGTPHFYVSGKKDACISILEPEYVENEMCANEQLSKEDIDILIDFLKSPERVFRKVDNWETMKLDWFSENGDENDPDIEKSMPDYTLLLGGNKNG